MKKNLLLILVALVFLGSNLFSQDWNEVMKIVASERTLEDNFGWSVSISGHFAIVGAYLEDEDESEQNTLLDAGAAYIFEKNNEGYWNLVQKIVASDRDSQDQFGNSVSISGNYAIVGAYFESEDVSGGNRMLAAGSAYFFERDEFGVWNQVQKIVASDRYYSDYFGHSVDISGDYAVIGAINNGGNAHLGAAYIFKRNDQGSWIETKILTSDLVVYAKFGSSVSIDQNYCIVGAFQESEVDNQGSEINWAAGAAYIFENDGADNWNRVNKFVAPIRRKDAHFGSSVGISGNYAIVGAEMDSYNEIEADSLLYAGAAFLYERDGSGVWDLVQKVIPSDRTRLDQFGTSVGISGDMAVVGSPFKDVVEGEDFYGWVGSAYVFNRSGNGTWEEDSMLIASDYKLGTANDAFGRAVGISGNYAIIASPYDDENNNGLNPLDIAGSAYVFSLCSEVAKNNQETICNGDSIMLSGKYQLEAGTFYDTLRAYTGCDSVITTVLTVNAVDTVVTMAEATLTAQAASGSYQWIDCSTNQNIQGETSQSFSPSTGGDYAVKLTQNGCVDTSYCYTFAMVGIEDLNLEGSVKVYPNPANNLLNIELDEMYEVINVRIMNILGKEVQQKQFKREQLLRIDISKLPSGPYFIQLQTPEGNASIRVVKNE